MKTTVPILLVMMSAIPLWAGSEVKARLESISSPNAWVDVDALVSDGHVRLSVSGPMAHGSLIYDRQTSLMTLVDDLHQVVLPVGSATQTALKMMGFMASGGLTDAMRGGPPSVQLAYKLMEENAQALLNGFPALSQKDVRRDGFICDLYETPGEGGKNREVWLTPRESTGVTGDDYETLWSLTRLVVDLFGHELKQMGADTAPFLNGYSNLQFPVHAVLYVQGKKSSRFKITAIHQRSLGPETFDPPAAYQTLGLLELIRRGIKGNS